jgi:hypothetical protein
MLPRLASAACAVVRHRDVGQSRRRSLVRVLTASLILAALGITAPASSVDLTPTPVKTAARPIHEFSAAAGGTWFGWAELSAGSRNYFVQRGSRPRIRANPKGTVALEGGIHRQTLVYTQSRGDTSSDLYRFNLRTGRRGALPDGVNTPRSEEDRPTLSGRYLLFTRERTTEGGSVFSKVVLYDRKTGALRVLARARRADNEGGGPFVASGQVNGAYAVWERGTVTDHVTAANVVRLNIRRDVRTTLPRPRRIRQEDPSVSSDGTVYFLRRSTELPFTQRIVKQPVGAPAEVLYTIPSNEFAYDLYVDDRVRARHVYFTLDVGRNNTDIYKLIDPLPSP